MPSWPGRGSGSAPRTVSTTGSTTTSPLKGVRGRVPGRRWWREGRGRRGRAGQPEVSVSSCLGSCSQLVPVLCPAAARLACLWADVLTTTGKQPSLLNAAVQGRELRAVRVPVAGRRQHHRNSPRPQSVRGTWFARKLLSSELWEQAQRFSASGDSSPVPSPLPSSGSLQERGGAKGTLSDQHPPGLTADGLWGGVLPWLLVCGLMGELSFSHGHTPCHPVWQLKEATETS